MTGRRARLAAVIIGAVITLAAAAASGASSGDGLLLVGLAVAGAGTVAVVGAALGRKLRAAPLAPQVTVIAITAVVATLAGAVLAAKAMFVSSHDLRALLVVMAASATAGALAALVLAERLGRASAAVAQLSERLATDRGARIDEPLPSELAAIADQLGATWRDLDDARQRERSMEAARRELVAWVSHDLRTPLSGIRAMAEALEDGVVEDPATVTRYLGTIRVETDRLAQLVDDLFELSRIQAGALDLELERVGLADLVSDAIAATGVAADARGVALRGAMHDPAPQVEASIPDLVRVIRNLLDNAIRHTPRGGEVTVEAATEGRYAVLSVRDRCGGIPTDEIERVFDLAFEATRRAPRVMGVEGSGSRSLEASSRRIGATSPSTTKTEGAASRSGSRSPHDLGTDRASAAHRGSGACRGWCGPSP